MKYVRECIDRSRKTARMQIMAERDDGPHGLMGYDVDISGKHPNTDSRKETGAFDPAKWISAMATRTKFTPDGELVNGENLGGFHEAFASVDEALKADALPIPPEWSSRSAKVTDAYWLGMNLAYYDSQRTADSLTTQPLRGDDLVLEIAAKAGKGDSEIGMRIIQGFVSYAFTLLPDTEFLLSDDRHTRSTAAGVRVDYLTKTLKTRLETNEI